MASPERCEELALLQVHRKNLHSNEARTGMVSEHRQKTPEREELLQRTAVQVQEIAQLHSQVNVCGKCNRPAS